MLVGNLFSFHLACVFLPTFIASAFSAPTFKLSNGVLTAEASRWFPKPTVTWMNQTGNVLNANTSFTKTSAGIFSIISTLKPVQSSGAYSCRIENNLVIAFSDAAITGIMF